ncbi:hypothetical protein MMC14_006192 [Varicellaria rhodocarpa]|nr:hypothetical protein [Varicellaria rhodocarpa]
MTSAPSGGCTVLLHEIPSPSMSDAAESSSFIPQPSKLSRSSSEIRELAHSYGVEELSVSAMDMDSEVRLGQDGYAQDALLGELGLKTDGEAEVESDMEYSEQVVEGGEMDDLDGIDQAEAKVIVGIGEYEFLLECILKPDLI